MAPKKTTDNAPAVATTKAVLKAPKASKAAAAADGAGDGAKKTLSPVPMPMAVRVAKALLESNPEIKVTQKDVKAICEAFVKTIVADTLEGNTVALPNYITFKRVLRKERTHKNPQTKEAILKPAHYVLTMDVKANLKKQFEEVKVVAPVPAVKKGGNSEDVAPAVTETPTAEV